MSENPKSAVRCPKCGSQKIRHSRKQNLWDSILDVLFSMEAFRCRSCRARFHKFDPGADAESEEAPAADSEPGAKSES